MKVGMGLFFYYDSLDGDFPSDYLANDKGWFLVSEKLKNIMEGFKTEVQYLPVRVKERNGTGSYVYYIANILKMVDGLCLERSDYFITTTQKLGPVYTIIKCALYADRLRGLDVFKLAKGHEIPVFVSQVFKDRVEDEGITGLSLREVRLVDRDKNLINYNNRHKFSFVPAFSLI